MLTHELGHCYRRFFRESAGYAQETSAPAGNLHAARDGAAEGDHDDELSADLFALAWSAAYNPSEFDDVYAFLQEMRFTLLPEDTAGRYASREELAAGLSLRPAGGPLNPRVLPRMALLFLN